ncbi:MAG: copper amine oxidase N-terminal domain-containing protein [Fimbriimonadaceae bacterium]|nr:hypothetical protein [Chthonomonadaceae bacterium]MCO5296483.1 copper amine oxidase N-terminal domain-containing protein [Fimbriimonadaceae bacterium]
MKEQLHRRFWTTPLALGLAVLPAFATAETVTIRRDSVIPVVLQDSLNFKDSRRGDRFSARVEESRDLPLGTVLEGRVLDVRPRRGDRPATMDLEFQNMVLPDGKRTGIRAVPIRLDDGRIRRGADGRLVASRGTSKEKFVLGGFLGGLILGNSIKKPFEGAVLGALAGIALAETQGQDGDSVAKRGTTLGAYFEREVKFDYRGPWNSRDFRNDDRYDPRDPDRRDYGDGRDPRDDRREPVISYEGRELRYGSNETPYWQGNTAMVPVERTARGLGLDAAWAGNRTLLIEDDRNLMRLDADSDEYRLNGRRGRLPVALVERGGVWYCPIEAFSAIRSNNVQVNGSRVGNKA